MEGADMVESEDENEEERAKGDSPDKEERTLFVGNIPKTFSEKRVRKLFKDFGAIESVRLRSLALEGTRVDQAGNQKLVKKVAAQKKLFSDAKDTLNAYVVFKAKENMEKALSLNNQVLDGRHLRVDRAVRDPNSHQRSVFLGNLPFDIDEEAVRAHFSASLEDGDDAIESVRLIRDPETMRGKGFGYILFKTKAAMSQSLKLHGSKLDKREIRVAPCGKRTKRSLAEEASQRKDKKRRTPGVSDGDPKPDLSGALRRLSAKGMKVQVGGKKKKKRPSSGPLTLPPQGKRSSFEGRRGSDALMERLQQGSGEKKKPKHMARKMALQGGGELPFKGSKPKKRFVGGKPAPPGGGGRKGFAGGKGFKGSKGRPGGAKGFGGPRSGKPKR